MSGSGTQGASAASVSDAARPTPKRVRGPRKSTLQALAVARQQGYDEGFEKAQHLKRERWPGAIAATVLAVVAFGLGAWLL